jgi:hypothetical protein
VAACTTSRWASSTLAGAFWPSSTEQEVTVVALDTGELHSVHLVEPDKGYWRNQRLDPGRWLGSRATGGLHVSPMWPLMTLARPTGVGRALAVYEVPIVGRDEWLAAAGLSA